MDPYVSALIGLIGVAVGSAGSFATAWLSQRFAAAMRFRELTISRREILFQDFINESSRLFADALSSQKDDVPELVSLYALIGRMRLIADPKVVDEAEKVMHRINDMYREGNLTSAEIRDLAVAGKLDILREFSEACRDELSSSLS